MRYCIHTNTSNPFIHWTDEETNSLTADPEQTVEKSGMSNTDINTRQSEAPWETVSSSGSQLF